MAMGTLDNRPKLGGKSAGRHSRTQDATATDEPKITFAVYNDKYLEIQEVKNLRLRSLLYIFEWNYWIFDFSPQKIQWCSLNPLANKNSEFHQTNVKVGNLTREIPSPDTATNYKSTGKLDKTSLLAKSGFGLTFLNLSKALNMDKPLAGSINSNTGKAKKAKGKFGKPLHGYKRRQWEILPKSDTMETQGRVKLKSSGRSSQESKTTNSIAGEEGIMVRPPGTKDQDSDDRGSDSSDSAYMIMEADMGDMTGIENNVTMSFSDYSRVPDQYGDDKQIYNMMFQLWMHGSADIEFPCYTSLHQAVETMLSGTGLIEAQRDARERQREAHTWDAELLATMEQWTLRLTREGNDGYPEAYHVVGVTCRLVYESRIRCYQAALRAEAEELLRLVREAEGEPTQVQQASEALAAMYEDAVLRHSQRALREYEETRAQYPREAYKMAETNFGTHSGAKDTAKAILLRFIALHQSAVEATFTTVPIKKVVEIGGHHQTRIELPFKEGLADEEDDNATVTDLSPTGKSTSLLTTLESQRGRKWLRPGIGDPEWPPSFTLEERRGRDILLDEITRLDKHAGTTQFLLWNGLTQYPTEFEKQQDPSITGKKKVLRELQNGLRKLGAQPGAPTEHIKANGIKLDVPWFEAHFARLFHFNEKTHVSSSIVIKLMEPIDVALVGTFGTYQRDKITGTITPIGLPAGGRVFDMIHMIYSDVEKVGRNPREYWVVAYPDYVPWDLVATRSAPLTVIRGLHTGAENKYLLAAQILQIKHTTLAELAALGIQVPESAVTVLLEQLWTPFQLKGETLVPAPRNRGKQLPGVSKKSEFTARVVYTDCKHKGPAESSPDYGRIKKQYLDHIQRSFTAGGFRMERFLNYTQMNSLPVHLEFTDEAHITDIHNVRTGIFAREAAEELMVIRNNGYRLSFAAGVYY